MGRNENKALIAAQKTAKTLAVKMKDFPEEEIFRLKGIISIQSALEETETEKSTKNRNVSSAMSKSKGEKEEDKNSKKVSNVNVPINAKSKLMIPVKSLQKLLKSWNIERFIPNKPSKSNLFGIFCFFLAFIFYFELHTASGFTRLWFYQYIKGNNLDDIRSLECTIEMPHLAMELFRPPVPCTFCQNVKKANRVKNISPEDFEKWYAYSANPVIITDGTKNWTAMNMFSFNFLKSIYSEGSRSLEHIGEDCLFFPYTSEFRSLAEVFNMSEKRFQRPWYIGWSNCDASASHILRQHYERPYFLPRTSESTHADWLFMGTHHGAHLHIDHVGNPSWQAQIKGKKRWSILPPPECLFSCHSFQIDVYPGDILVIDTNKYYHSTEIISEEMSITIGSEFD